MKPQLTLQTPLELPYQEISNYLNKLWISEDKDNSGANTFTLMVWQPAWLEQCLVQKGLVNGPITGNLSPEIIEVAKKFILDQGLPITTSLNSEELLNLLKENLSNKDFEDFRGQFFESSISTLNPRRLITLAPTLNKNSDIKTFVSAYCPLSDTPAMQPICGDLVVIRGDSASISNKGLKIIDELSIDELPSWLWWNGSLDESPFLISWISDKLGWSFLRVERDTESTKIEFERINGEIISASINPLSLGNPSIHLGQVIGLRLISKISEVQKNNTCVILGCESVECMRLEAGGMANMELIEQVVPNSFSTSEYDVSKLLGSSRGNTSPLFENSIKIALQIFNGLNN